MASSGSWPFGVTNDRLTKVRLTVDTLKHISGRQLLFLIKRRLLVRLQPRYLSTRYRLNGQFTLNASLPNPQSRVDGNRLKFLNTLSEFTIDRVDWCSENQTVLWRYNLHYFDYLKDDELSDQFKLTLVADWIDRNPVGTPVAWDSFTTSLRIINWVKWFDQQRKNSDLEQPIPDRFERSLNLQGRWLARNIEYDIAANHLFKNIVALLFWSHYFNYRRAINWRVKSLKLLWEQLDEQFLDDGGHYERSPMYHSLMLEFCLDCINLLQQFSKQSLLHQAVIRKLDQVIVKGIDFLQVLIDQKGNIPLFHDSAHNIANCFSRLAYYAERLGSEIKPLVNAGEELHPNSHFTLRHFLASGYVIASRGMENRMLMDVGQVSPAYQPGHSHCSLLSYELTKDSHSIVTDTGVYEYQNSNHRSYSRSTNAHNTIQVDDLEQSEIWGGFRIARRAKVQDVSVTQSSEGVTISASLCGFFQGTNCYKQERKVSISNNFTMSVNDRITHSLPSENGVIREIVKNSCHRVRSFIHIAPRYTFVIQNHHVLVIGDDGCTPFVIHVAPKLKLSIISGWYYPEFGKKVERQTLVIETNSTLPVQISYRIESVG